MKRNLTNLSEGETCRVTEIHTSVHMQKRLRSLGLVEGTDITCAHKSPHGDPVAYIIRGTLIALRNNDAYGVVVC